ncbi:agmatine deiminase [Gammaproteobacteria bacterium]
MFAHLHPFLPPEWAPQSAILLAWPHPDSDWGPLLSEVETVFTTIAAAICRHERLLIAVHNEQVSTRVTHCLNQAGVAEERYTLFHAPYNDTWMRDTGPITVIEDGWPVLLNFRFNGWGGKFNAELDDALTLALHTAGAFGSTPSCQFPLVLEGGSIEVDGAGGLLTTSSCLLAPTRNPEMDRSEVEAALRSYFGVERIHWLHHGGLAGDDTDGHIDTLARFCSPHLIAYQACTDPDDEHFGPLRAMAEELATLRQTNEEPYHLAPLPWPRPHYAPDGHRLPATYANFLILNDAVLVPTYDDPADVQALNTLQHCFPDRQIVGIPCSPLLLQHGSLHCVTMQLPSLVIIPNFLRG